MQCYEGSCPMVKCANKHHTGFWNLVPHLPRSWPWALGAQQDVSEVLERGLIELQSDGNDSLCGGEMMLRFTCNSQMNSHTWVRTEQFTVKNVALPMQSSNMPFTVTAPVIAMYELENVEVRCFHGSTCGAVRARTSGKMTKFPEQLFVVRLLRFTATTSVNLFGRTTTSFTKNNQAVTVLPHLTFSSDVVFELCGTLVHRGTSRQSGHYVAYVLQPDGRWMLFDDPHQIEYVDAKAACATSAYMLFYRRIVPVQDNRQLPAESTLPSSSADSLSASLSWNLPECVVLGGEQVVLHRPKTPMQVTRKVDLSHGTVVLLPQCHPEYLRCIGRLFEDLRSTCTLMTDTDNLDVSHTSPSIDAAPVWPPRHVTVVAGDMINIAMSEAGQGHRVCIHNFANDHTVGGGTWKGVQGPQEESLMQRSGGLLLNPLERSEWTQRDSDTLSTLPRYSYVIPSPAGGTQGLGGEVIGANEYYGALVVNHLNFPFDHQFRFQPPPNVSSLLSVVCSAAPNMSLPVNQQHTNSRLHLDHLVHGWKVTLWAAFQCDVDCLVTGQWGTGVFCNDPKIVQHALARAVEQLPLQDPFRVIFVDKFQAGNSVSVSQKTTSATETAHQKVH